MAAAAGYLQPIAALGLHPPEHLTGLDTACAPINLYWQGHLRAAAAGYCSASLLCAQCCALQLSSVSKS